jgi:hypothetical protein
MDLYKQRWAKAWKSHLFRKKLIIGFILIAVILSAFPFFFQVIEKRTGTFLNDWLLNRMPVHDVSIMIFILIWATSLLTLFRAIQHPGILMQFLWSYILLCVLRMITISLIALDPPVNLLPLADPIANAFYGPHFVTRDLFFSGHTATVFLMALCLKNRTDKTLAFLASTGVGILLLVQHVHYTIDIIAAPFLTYLIYLMGRKIANAPDRGTA